jgi:hypothetical protein
MSILPDYLKDLVEAAVERRKFLDTKAEAVVTVSGTVVTLLFAFIALLIGNDIMSSSDKSLVPGLSNLVLAVVFAITLGIAAMLFGILTFRIMKMPGGIDINQFLITENRDKIRESIKEALKKEDASPLDVLINDKKLTVNLEDSDDIKTGIAKYYIELITFHREINQIKTRYFFIASWLIFACILSIGLIAFLVWRYLPILIQTT